MKRCFSSSELKVLKVIQQGFPNTLTPYTDLAQKINLTTEELLGILTEWKKQGKLRRVGAIVNHFEIGLAAGAMVVWRVESDKVEGVGKILASFKEVSHAYEREVSKNWPYNLYTMVHGENTEDIERTVRKMSNACKVFEYRVLLTIKELKKVPPTYIVQ